MRAAVDLSDLIGSGAGVSQAPATVTPSGASAAASGGVSYDASSKIDRLARWQPPIRSADAEILPEKGDIDARSRDMVRNDAFVSGASDSLRDSIVGTRYQLNARPETKVLWGKEDETWETEFQEEVETKFTLWAESPNKWPDASRINTLTAMVRLAVCSFFGTGEVLASAEWLPASGRPYRTAVQMIDPDRLSTPRDKLLQDYSRIRSGVERDRRGAPLAYHIRNSHPNDGPFHDYSDLREMQWTRVPTFNPWGRRNILHIYEQDRPDQSRGIADYVSALTEMRMTKHFRRTELERAVLAASYAASIESEIPDDVIAALGGGTTDGNATVEWMTAYLSALEAYNSGASNLHMDGVRIPVFAPGTKLKLQSAGANGPLGDKYEQSLLRYTAAALGLSYEQFAHDYTQTNYSSARASIGESQKAMNAKKRIAADGTADFVYLLWLEEAVNNNDLECLKRSNVPNFYEGLNAEAYGAAEWIGAGQGQIDPLKETQAAVLKVKSGFSTKEAEIARMSGGDYRRVARQIKRERDLDAFYKNPSIYEQADSKDMVNSLSASPREGDSA
ncbi:phage portal protein [Rhizobium wenxiniae]|uniref:phage portal protein n=1 Tax=Rhizobium wenxiniae TaxID=1737357 RepID=UPI003C1E99C0